MSKSLTDGAIFRPNILGKGPPGGPDGNGARLVTIVFAEGGPCKTTFARTTVVIALIAIVAVFFSAMDKPIPTAGRPTGVETGITVVSVTVIACLTGFGLAFSITTKPGPTSHEFTGLGADFAGLFAVVTKVIS